MLLAVGMDGQHALHHFRRHLSVRGVGGADLVAGGLDGAGLMAVDMAGVGGDHCLVGGQQRGDDRHVRLGAAHQKMNGGVGGSAEGANQCPGFVADGINAVAAGLGEIGVHQRLQDPGMCALAVIVAEAVHEKNLFSVIGLLPLVS